MGKHFIISNSKSEVDVKELHEIRVEKEKKLFKAEVEKEKQNISILQNIHSNIKPVFGRVIVAVNIEEKNSHTFSDGSKIRLERDYNNLNRREVSPVNAIVVSSNYMPPKSKVLIGHNAVHDVNRLFNYDKLSGQSEGGEVKYYSLLESECFLYKEEGDTEWQPCKGYATALRIYKPYTGFLHGIEPTVIPNKLFITSGEFKNKAVATLKSCDYEVVYQGDGGKEERKIRIRHFEQETEHEREEITAIDHDLTAKINSGEYHIGLSKSDATPLNDSVCQN